MFALKVAQADGEDCQFSVHSWNLCAATAAHPPVLLLLRWRQRQWRLQTHTAAVPFALKTCGWQNPSNGSKGEPTNFADVFSRRPDELCPICASITDRRHGGSQRKFRDMKKHPGWKRERFFPTFYVFFLFFMIWFYKTVAIIIMYLSCSKRTWVILFVVIRCSFALEIVIK